MCLLREVKCDSVVAPSIQLRFGEMIRVRRKLAFLPEGFKPFLAPKLDDF